MHQARSRFLAPAAPLLLLLLLFQLAGAAAAQSRNPGYVEIFDTVSNTTVPASGDNFGVGHVIGTENVRLLALINLETFDLEIHNCSISSPWALGDLPADGPGEPIYPGLHYDMHIFLTSPQYGDYTGIVSCEGSAGFIFPVSWRLLNPSATISVAAGSTPIAPGSAFNFPTTLGGTTASQVFTITNYGATALTVSNVGESGAGFTTTQPLQTINAGTSTFTVTFAPTSGSLYSAGLTIKSNDSVGNGTFKINLTGSGIGAAAVIKVADVTNNNASMSPGQSDSFGTPLPGSAVTHTFRITNSGNVALTISNPNMLVSGDGYSLASVPPSSVAANGGTALFSVTFSKNGTGTFPGQISISSNSTPSPFTFPLTATLQTQPSGVTFRGPAGAVANGGTYNLGQAAIGQPLRVTFQTTNISPSNLTLSLPVVAGDAAFLLDSANGGTMAPNQTLLSTVRFTPTSATSSYGTMKFTAGGTPWTINLVATGVAAAPAMGVTWSASGAAIQNGGTYSFGSTAAGTPLSQAFTISNTGMGDLTLGNVAVSSPNGCFSLIANPPTPISGAGGTSTGRIRLSSTQAGSCSGTATITSNDSATPTFTFNLTGTVSSSAVPYSLSVLSGDGISIPPGGSYASFPATTANVAVSRAFTITNNGAAAISIDNASSILSSSGGFSLLVSPPTSIPAGGTGTFRIRLLAASAGSYGGTVTISGDPAGPYTFTLGGTVN